MRYAVYVVVVEDTDEADMALAESVVSLERIDADESEDEAIQYMEDVARGVRM